MAKKRTASIGERSLSLIDIGLSCTKACHIYDKESLDENGNLISFSDQLAIVTHYLHLHDTKFASCYANKGLHYIDLWTSKGSKTNTDHVKEYDVSQLFLFKDCFKVPFPPPDNPDFTFVDLFAGIGGFRISLQECGGLCVYSSEWDENAKRTYFHNFGDIPFGDITKNLINKSFQRNLMFFVLASHAKPSQLQVIEKDLKTHGELFLMSPK